MNIYVSLIVFCSVMSFSFSLFAAENINNETGEFLIEYKFKKQGAQYDEKISSVTPVCDFEIQPAIDMRQNKETVGATFNLPLRAYGIGEWLNSVMLDVRKYVNSTSAHSITIKPELIRLYTYTQGLNIHGVIAMRLHYYSNGSLLASHNVRGFSSKSNWAGGIGEHNTTLNLSVSNIIPKILEDMSGVCNQNL